MKNLFNQNGFLKFLKKDPLFLLKNFEKIVDLALKQAKDLSKNGLEKTTERYNDCLIFYTNEGKHYIFLDVYYFPNEKLNFSESIHCILILDFGISFKIPNETDKKFTFSYELEQTLSNTRAYLIDRNSLLNENRFYKTFEMKLIEQASEDSVYQFEEGREISFSSINFEEIKESLFFFL